MPLSTHREVFDERVVFALQVLQVFGETLNFGLCRSGSVRGLLKLRLEFLRLCAAALQGRERRRLNPKP